MDHINEEAYWIGQDFFESGQDWSEFLEGAGMVRMPLGFGGIGRNSFGSGWDSLELV